MNLKLQDEAAFFAKYQNEPILTKTVDASQLTDDAMAASIQGCRLARVPPATRHARHTRRNRRRVWYCE